MGSLCVHERTSRYGGSRADSSTACPACGQNVESLSHLMFDCPATSAQRDTMLDEILFCAKLLVALKNCAMFWHCLMHRSSCCVLFLMMFGVARGFVG
jgi:hypothetical protein